MKKLLRNRGLLERGERFSLKWGRDFLRKGGSQLLHQFSLSMFLLLWKYFFLFSKYSHLIDIFFQVVYFLLENAIL